MSNAAYHRKWYQRNKDRIRKQKNERSRLRRKRIADQIRDYKAEHGCMDCGESDPIVLDLDHRDPSLKVDSVCDMIRRGFAAQKIFNEVDKCDVVCANCHRHRTWKRRCTGARGGVALAHNA